MGVRGDDRTRTQRPTEVATLLLLGLYCTQCATPASGRGRGARAPPDVIAARRRLRFCYFAGEVVGANGFRTPVTDSPSRGPAHLLLFRRGAAMVSRPGGRATTEGLQAGCGRGAAAGRDGEDGAECSEGPPLRVRGAPRMQRAGMWLLRGTFTPPPSLGGREEGRRMLIWTGH